MGTALAKVYDIAKRSQESLKRYRAKEKEHTNELLQRGGTAVSTVAGLALAGAIDGKWGTDGKAGYEGAPAEVNGIACIGPVPINAAAGLILVATGVPGILPGSEYMTALGAAMFGYPIAKTIEARIREKAAK